MMPVRRLLTKLQNLQPGNEDTKDFKDSKATQSLPNRSSLRSKFSNEKIDVDAVLKADSVSQEDLRLAKESTKPSSGGTISRYEEWQVEFGSV